MNEIWHGVVGFEGLYEVSNCGRVRRIGASTGGGRNRTRIGHILSPSKQKYINAHLYRDGKCYAFGIHRLVVAAFLGAIPPGHEVNHRDADRHNNIINNLEIVTSAGNHAHISKLRRWNPKTKLSANQVTQIRERHRKGESYKDIGSAYSVSKSAISLICSGRNWRIQEVPQ